MAALNFGLVDVEDYREGMTAEECTWRGRLDEEELQDGDFPESARRKITQECSSGDGLKDGAVVVLIVDMPGGPHEVGRFAFEPYMAFYMRRVG